MRIKFFALFHNNLEDFINELRKFYRFKFVIPMKYKEMCNLRDEEVSWIYYKNLNIFNKTLLYYPLTKLYNNIEEDDTFIVVKHIFQPINFLIFFICKLKRKKLIIYQQKIKKIEPKISVFLIRFFLKLILPKNTKAYSVINQGYEELHKYIDEVFYIPFAIDESKYSKRVPKYTGKNLKILCIGSFNPTRKNHLLLIKSLEFLQKKYPGIEFNLTMTGSCNHESENYNIIKDYLKKSPIKSHVSIVKNIKKNMIEKEISNYDLFVLPSYNEPASYSNLEAMASSLPVIVSQDNGTSCYIKEGTNGYIFKRNDLDDLSIAIENFITLTGNINWEKINKFGENSLSIVRKKHAPKKVMNEFRGMLKD